MYSSGGSEGAGGAVRERLPLSPTDFHLLLVLSEAPTYGYALMKAMDAQSGGVISPEIGSLYRMLARLESNGLVAEAGDHPAGETDRPGRPRRYFRITSLGRSVLDAESRRLRALMARADGAVAASPGNER